MLNGCVGNFNDVKGDNSFLYLFPAFLSRKTVWLSEYLCSLAINKNRFECSLLMDRRIEYFLRFFGAQFYGRIVIFFCSRKCGSCRTDPLAHCWNRYYLIVNTVRNRNSERVHEFADFLFRLLTSINVTFGKRLAFSLVQPFACPVFSDYLPSEV